MRFRVRLPKASILLTVEEDIVTRTDMGWMLNKEWKYCETWLLSRGAKIERYDKTM